MRPMRPDRGCAAPRGRPGRRASASIASGGREVKSMAHCDPTERRRPRPRRTGRGSRLWASACILPPDSLAEERHQGGLVEAGDLPDRREPARAQPPGRRRADAPERLDRQRVEEGPLAARRHDQQAVRLGDGAGHLGEELGRRHAHRDRQPHLLAHAPAQVRRDLGRRARDPLEPAHVEEGLVDRQALDERRGPLEDPEHGPAGLDVGRPARLDDDRLGAEAARPPPAHRRAHARAPAPRSWRPGRRPRRR